MRRNYWLIRFKLTDSFFTISNSARGGYKEKGSKFIAFAHPVADSEQIKVKLDEIRKEYYDASHHCYAWILGPEKEKYKVFDDGEPSHTAGDPILNQIKSKHLTNLLVVVVRYFGGTKLGASGLTQAYKKAAADVLDKATIHEVFITHNLTVDYDYPETSQIKKLIHEFDLKVIHENFSETCSMSFEIRLSQEEKFKERIKTLTLQGCKIYLA